MENSKYFNFPIYLLQGFLSNTKQCLIKIHYYAVYYHSLKLEEGTDFEKFKSSAKFYGVIFHDPNDAFIEGKILNYEDSQSKRNSPKVGLKTEIFWDYYKNHKSQFQKVTLLAFLALKSILQNKSYCKITNNYWLARMDGRSSTCELNELSPEIRKYGTRHYIDKIKEELRNNWNLNSPSVISRGFYVSFTLSKYKLIKIIESNKKEFRTQQRKKQEREIQEQILKELYDGNFDLNGEYYSNTTNGNIDQSQLKNDNKNKQDNEDDIENNFLSYLLK